ncbi:hypothetical protein BDW62DRAFT_192802 [Aspergillus aurantiobrunneus]
MPEPPLLQDDQELDQNGPGPLYGGLILHQDDTASQNVGIEPPDESTTVSPKRRSSKTGEAARKRGRPRKLIDNTGVSPDERRRMQVRMAQRAYRSRKDANVSSLKDRINQLETAVRQMSTAVISFGDDLVRSGALGSHPDLLKPLGNTVQACLALPALPHGDFDYQDEAAESTAGRKKRIPPSPSGSEGAETMEIAEFIDRLHVTCSYQAYLVCANPAVPSRRIERPFRILLSLMPRAFVAEFFKDWLLARAGQKTLDHWDHIPFFRLGGAGTHYPVSGNMHFPFPTRQGSFAVEEDVLRFPFDVQKDLEDEWFDLRDLQGYLRERQTVFPASATPMSTIGSGLKEQATNGVSRLMQRLVKGAICLGRSPGFRRRDVEAAVDEFVASQGNAST